MEIQRKILNKQENKNSDRNQFLFDFCSSFLFLFLFSFCTWQCHCSSCIILFSLRNTKTSFATFCLHFQTWCKIVTLYSVVILSGHSTLLCIIIWRQILSYNKKHLNLFYLFPSMHILYLGPNWFCFSEYCTFIFYQYK